MIVTDENGIADFRGFFGDYEIEIKTDSGPETKVVKLSKNGENNFTIAI